MRRRKEILITSCSVDKLIQESKDSRQKSPAGEQIGNDQILLNKKIKTKQNSNKELNLNKVLSLKKLLKQSPEPSSSLKTQNYQDL